MNELLHEPGVQGWAAAAQAGLHIVVIVGVDRWADASVILRRRRKTLPLPHWGARRAFLKPLKQAFDDMGIEIPFPRLGIRAGQPGCGTAAPFQMQGDSHSDPRASA